LGPANSPVPAVVVCIGVPDEGAPLFLGWQALL